MSADRPSMTVDEPEWSDRGVTLGVRLGGRRIELGFGAAGIEEQSADFALPSTLLLAMASAADLRLQAPVSGRLLDAIPSIGSVLGTWGPTWNAEFRRIAVGAPRDAGPPATPGRGVASVFSGGVDSFYTALDRHDELTAVIFIHGFDVRMKDTLRRAEALRNVSAAAEALGLELVEVEVTTRPITDPMVPWQAYHGGVLAAIAQLFQHRFRKVYLPATHPYDELVPWGTHPVLDHLWSTDRLAIEHHGAGASRVEKVRQLCDSDVAMRHLRVCWAGRETQQNCGVCEKCVRTTMNLASNGALERCQTLPDSLDPAVVEQIHVRGPNDAAFVRENRAALEARGGYPEIVEALRNVEHRFHAATVEPLISPIRGELVHARRELDETRRHLELAGSDAEAARADAGRWAERATAAERMLNEFRGTRRYRAAQAIARPLDRLRGS